MAEVEFFGDTFRLNPASDYQMELLEFADAATAGADSEMLAGMAAVVRLLKAAVSADDWDKFWSTAKRNKAQVRADLMPVVVQAFAQPIDRPTGLPSDSSDGQASTPQNSGGGSYLQVVKRLEEQGRPELAHVVVMANEDRLTA